MKNLFWISALITLALSACTSQKQATSYVNDDVYISSSKPKNSVPSTSSNQQGAQVVTTPDKSTAKKPASSTFEDDYNDYSYSSRIDRFNSKDTTKGYFDQSYTGGDNSDQSSGGSNVSIYLGAGFGGGFYGPSFYYGMGWGSPYSYWGYGYGYGWGYPYYGYYDPWYYPWYRPWYNPWYYPCCYCYGYNDYYTPYYSTNTYYGSRKSLYRADGGSTSPNARDASGGSANTMNRSGSQAVAPTYSRSLNQPSARTTTPSERSTVQTPQSTPVSQEKYRYTRPAAERSSGYQRTTTQETGRTSGEASRQQPAPRYIRPENESAGQRSGSAQSYSSPVYRQPKSSQEYLAPRTQSPVSTRSTTQSVDSRSGNNNTGNSGSRQYASPGNTTRTYSNPSRSGSSGYQAPRSNSTYQAPARTNNNESYSSPSRSGGGSYSTPSNSNNGGSYSAPARSGGSGGGMPSGGGGSNGGGGRRR